MLIPTTVFSPGTLLQALRGVVKCCTCRPLSCYLDSRFH